MGYGPAEEVSTSTKPEILSSEIYALETITDKLDDLINRISGTDSKGVQEIQPAPPSYCITELMTAGVDRIADTRRRALEQIDMIYNMLF